MESLELYALVFCAGLLAGVFLDRWVRRKIMKLFPADFP